MLHALSQDKARSLGIRPVRGTPCATCAPELCPTVVVCVRTLFEMTIGVDLAACKTVEDAVRRFDEAGDERGPEYQEKVMKWFT